MDQLPYLQSDIEEIAERLGPLAQQFSGKTVVFTGACGFLGAHFMGFFEHLNRAVLDKPARVLAFDCFISSAYDADVLRRMPSITFAEHNVVQPLPVTEPVDFVFHAAGIASPVWYRTNPLETLEVAAFGTRQVLEFARAKGARVLYFSSSEIYGDPDAAHVPTSENYHGYVSCRGPRACYDEGKRVGETLCDIFHEHFGVRTVTVRPFNVYGPGMREKDSRVLPNFASRIKSGRALQVYGSGAQTRTFCYVADAVYGFLLALLKGVPGEAYNIGNPNPEISMEELARRMTAVAGRGASYRVVDYPDGYPSNEPQRRCPDIQKAELHLGYSARIELDEGLRRFLVWSDKAYVGIHSGA